MTDVLECLCGSCAPCRREMRAMEAAERAAERRNRPPRTGLSPEAQKLLDEALAGRDKPARRSRPKGDRPKAVRRAPKPREPLTPVPCTACGQMRVVVPYGRGYALAGTDGLCELCYDTPRMRQAIADHESGAKVLRKDKLREARRKLERVFRDGRPYHPEASHGKVSAYQTFGCRCEPCRGSKVAYRKEWVSRQ